MVRHPLVSPLAASKEMWMGAPPVWVGVGWEGMQDEAEVFCRKVFGGSEVNVVLFEGFEGMPHCFRYRSILFYGDGFVGMRWG